MIDFYYWPTPNGWKISIALEEMELPYEAKFVNIGRGEQFSPEFLAISPNNRMPAIVDHDPPGGSEPVSIFESGAILIYLAEKTGRFLPGAMSGVTSEATSSDLRQRVEVLEWLMWQMGGLGPMLGQNHHFRISAPEPMPYALDRYTDETRRLYGVLDKRLDGREYICGEFSIADMACWPWIVPHKTQSQTIGDFPNLQRWYEKMKTRPGVQRGFDLGIEIRKGMSRGPDEEARRILFGQAAKSGQTAKNGPEAKS